MKIDIFMAEQRLPPGSVQWVHAGCGCREVSQADTLQMQLRTRAVGLGLSSKHLWESPSLDWWTRQDQ